MKKWNTKLLKCLFCSTFLISSLNAIDVDPETIKIINASSAREADVTAYQEKDIARDKVDDQNEEKREHIAKREQPITTIKGSVEEDEEVINEMGLLAAYYATSHRAAYHKPINISADGLNVEFEDQSIWEVHSWDANKLKTWNLTQTVLIAPNKNIFTRWSYPYKLINLDNGDIAKANMKFTPVLNDPNVDIFVHWIEDIDYSNRMLRLEDGSVWNILWSDKDMMYNFARYNIVIVGTNDGWYRGSNPNILICVRNNQYIRGVVVN